MKTMEKYKGTKVNKIGDGVKTLLKVKGYAILEDRWVSENDKFLFDQNGNTYTVLDFTEIEEYINYIPKVIEPGFILPISNWQLTKLSCVKLDKEVNVGDILYVCKYYWIH